MSSAPSRIYTYGILLAAAYLVGLWFAAVRARARGLDGNRVTDLGIYIIISALVGAKLLLVVVEFDHFRRDPAEIWTVLRSGGVFYGGLLLAVGVAFWHIRRHRLPIWTTCDAFAPGIALGPGGGPARLPVGRLLLRPADRAAVGGSPSPTRWRPPTSARRSTSACIRRSSTSPSRRWASWALLLLMERRGPSFPGRTFWAYLLLYPCARFGIEYFRGDPRGMVLDALSTSQFVSLLLVPVSIVMLLRLRRSWSPEPTREQARARAA